MYLRVNKIFEQLLAFIKFEDIGIQKNVEMCLYKSIMFGNQSCLHTLWNNAEPRTTTTTFICGRQPIMIIKVHINSHLQYSEKIS